MGYGNLTTPGIWRNTPMKFHRTSSPNWPVSLHATQEPAGKSQEGSEGRQRATRVGPVSVTFPVGTDFRRGRKNARLWFPLGVGFYPPEKPRAKASSTFGYSRGKARERLPPWIAKGGWSLARGFSEGYVVWLRRPKCPFGCSKGHGNDPTGLQRDMEIPCLNVKGGSYPWLLMQFPVFPSIFRVFQVKTLRKLFVSFRKYPKA